MIRYTFLVHKVTFLMLTFPLGPGLKPIPTRTIHPHARMSNHADFTSTGITNENAKGPLHMFTSLKLTHAHYTTSP